MYVQHWKYNSSLQYIPKFILNPLFSLAIADEMICLVTPRPTAASPINTFAIWLKKKKKFTIVVKQIFLITTLNATAKRSSPLVLVTLVLVKWNEWHVSLLIRVSSIQIEKKCSLVLPSMFELFEEQLNCLLWIFNFFPCYKKKKMYLYKPNCKLMNDLIWKTTKAF